MLEIHIPAMESFNSSTNRFVEFEAVTLQLEHSLVSLSKWEAIFEKAFLSKEDKTPAEVFGYVKAMTLNPDVPAEVYDRLTQANMDEISSYMNAKQSATWFNELPPNPNQRRDVITGEIIYYWMNTLNVPMECDKWHLNRLITLIKVHNAKNQPKKKAQRPTADSMAARRAAGERARQMYNTRG